MNQGQPKPALDPGLIRRLHMALTASHDELFQTLLDPAPEVLRNLLKNPNLGEDHLLALLKRRDLSEDLAKAVSQLALVGRSHRLKHALAKNPATPAPVVLSLLPHLYLFELLDFCLLPGFTPDQRLAAERQITLRLTTAELGHKTTLARRGTAAIVEALLKGGEDRVVQACLDNPRLKEASILQFLRSGRATAETISMIARHPRWQNRSNLRLAILKHSRTPAVWFTLWLPKLKKSELTALVHGRTLGGAQKKRVDAEMRKRGLG